MVTTVLRFTFALSPPTSPASVRRPDSTGLDGTEPVTNHIPPDQDDPIQVSGEGVRNGSRHSQESCCAIPLIFDRSARLGPARPGSARQGAQAPENISRRLGTRIASISPSSGPAFAAKVQPTSGHNGLASYVCPKPETANCRQQQQRTRSGPSTSSLTPWCLARIRLSTPYVKRIPTVLRVLH